MSYRATGNCETIIPETKVGWDLVISVRMSLFCFLSVFSSLYLIHSYTRYFFIYLSIYLTIVDTKLALAIWGLMFFPLNHRCSSFLRIRIIKEGQEMYIHCICGSALPWR